ncbi:MAG: translation initiation factor IF-2 [Microcoleaceae cyanobacterium MO_207.B10]|nr:translation initiation factor IF-2 [Microcoleaceae cyanobacterium MO_207.B10]
MGFADLSIQEIAEDFNVDVDEVLRLCDQFGISYKHSKTRLALEDAKAIMSHLLAQDKKSHSD